MDNIALGVGMVVLTLGGILLAACIICFIGWLLTMVWVAFSENFRAICKAESLILEYRKNRDEFLKWKEGAEDEKS